MNKRELRKAFEEKMISEEKFKDELFKLETGVKSERKAKRLYEALTEEEFIKLLKETNGEKHRVAFILAYGSGLRVSEIVSLQPEDIDLLHHKIFIRQAKGSKDRIVNTPKWLKEKHIKYLPFNFKNEKAGIRSLEAVFFRASMKAGLNRAIGTFLRRGKEVSLFKFRLHSLRHSYCTRLIENLIPLNQVQTLMGHSNLSTTSGYAKASSTDAINSVLEKEL